MNIIELAQMVTDAVTEGPQEACATMVVAFLFDMDESTGEPPVLQPKSIYRPAIYSLAALAIAARS